MLFGVRLAEAATSLGWATTITLVANEVRNIGFVCVGLSIVLLGMYIIFRRRLEDLGHDLSAVSVGTVLISTGVTSAAALIGAAGAAPVAGTLVLPGIVESLGTFLSFWVWQGSLGVWLWRRFNG